MTAKITPADRAAAHANIAAYGEEDCDYWRGCGGVLLHQPMCDRLAQAIADAREAENRACEELLRDCSRQLRAESGDWISENDSLSAHEAMGDSIGFRKAADVLAARRSR